MSIGAIIEQLEMLAKASNPHHVKNQVVYLPLWRDILHMIGIPETWGEAQRGQAIY